MTRIPNLLGKPHQSQLSAVRIWAGFLPATTQDASGKEEPPQSHTLGFSSRQSRLSFTMSLSSVPSREASSACWPTLCSLTNPASPPPLPRHPAGLGCALGIAFPLLLCPLGRWDQHLTDVSSPSRAAVHSGWAARFPLERQLLRPTDGPGAPTTGALGCGADPGLWSSCCVPSASFRLCCLLVSHGGSSGCPWPSGGLPALPIGFRDWLSVVGFPDSSFYRAQDDKPCRPVPRSGRG